MGLPESREGEEEGMKQRFVVTLLAVAIASLSASAFAVAPMINDFRSPIIADDTPATNSNDFVYPSTFNLTTQASDPDNTVPANQIKWSFFQAGTQTYSLNNRASLNLGTDDPNAPGAKEITGGATPDDPEAGDADLRTVTFRNIVLSPLPLPPTTGTLMYPNSAANGGDVGPQILPAQTKVITMFASDGQAASSKTLMVYTENKGIDRLSGKSFTVGPTVVPTGWTSVDVIPPGATMTSSASTGICIQTGLTAPGFGVWTSPFGVLTLVQNNVYRVRINVESTAPIAAGVTPLWDLVIDNVRTNPDGSLFTGSQNKYSLDALNWDTNGSANSVGLASGGRRTFDIYYAPLPVQAADWNSASGEFAAANDAFNDARFQFRVIDVQGAVDGNNDAGTVCLKSYQIDRIDINDLSVGSTVLNIATPTGELKNGTPGFQTSGSNMSVGTIFTGSTTVTNNTGLIVSPVGTGWNTVEIVDIDVGDDNIDFGSGATLADNWPIPWNSNELLRITAGGQAPNATGESNPPDTLRILMDAPTSEVGMDSLLSAGANLLGLPKAASATTYTAFYYTQNKTNATAAGFAALRPRVSMINVNTVLSGGLTTNNGGFKLTFLKVDKINPVD
jgi:hypothetical protein